jgi:heme exporter protein CcmD
MSAHAWFVFVAYAVTALAIGAVALTVILDHRALKDALARVPAADEESAA